MKLKLIFVITMVVFLFSSFVLADDIGTTVDVGTSTPTAMSATINSGMEIVLSSGTTTLIEGTVVVSDSNGYADITGVEGILYRSDLASTDSDDNENHYTSSCVSDGDGLGTSETYTCSFDVQHYADPTDDGSIYSTSDWLFLATPSDGTGVGTSDSVSVEMYTLTAFSVNTSSLDFGTLSLGSDTGSINEEIEITNEGNVNLDFNINGNDMTCTSGVLGVSYLKYSLSSFDYSMEGTALSSAPTQVSLNLGKGSEIEALPVDYLYFGLGFPSSGIGGTCSGTITLTAST